MRNNIRGSLLYSPPTKAELKQARADGRETARQIAELCVVAGRAELAADLIVRGLSVETVKAALAGDTGGRPEAGGTETLADGVVRQARQMDRQASAALWDAAFA